MRFLFPGLDVGGGGASPPAETYPVSTYAGAWFIDEPVQADGTILDERTGLGTDRDRQPKRALDLDGTQYGQLATPPAISYPLSMSIWLKGDATVNTYAMSLHEATSKYIDIRTSPIVGAYYRLERRDTASYYVDIGDPSGAAFDHVICVLHDETTIDIYFNGVKTSHTGLDSYSIGTVANLFLGNFRPGTSSLFDSALFDARIYDKALTEAEAQHVYTFGQSGTNPGNSLANWKLDDNSTTLAKDSSGNGNDATLVNAPTTYTGQDVPYSWQNEVGYSVGYNGFDYSDLITGYGLTNATRVTGQTDPFGGTKAFLLRSGVTVASRHYLNDTGWTTNGFIYSIYAKAGGYNYVLLSSHPTSTPENRGSIFNLSTGTVSSLGSGQTAKIEDVGNGWYRCSIDAGSSGSSSFAVQLSDDGVDGVFNGDGVSGVYLFGGQYEVNAGDGNWPKPFHPTYGTSNVGWLIPRDESNPTKDVDGNDLEKVGVCPDPGFVDGLNVLKLNGTNQYVSSATALAALSVLNDSSGSVVFSSANGFGVLFANTINGNDRFSISLSTDVLRVAFYDGSFNSVSFSSVSRNEFHRLDWSYESGVLTATLDGVSSDNTSSAATSSAVGWNIGSTTAETTLFTGQIANLEIYDENGDPIFNIPCSDGAGDYVTDTVNETQYAITNPASNWDVTTGYVEGMRPVNMIDGFSLYKHATLDPLRIPYVDSVPFDSPTVPSGYTLTGHFPPGNGNNNSEAALNFTFEPDGLDVGVTVPGDGTTDPATFGGDYGDLTVGVDTATLQGKFTLERS